MRFENGATYMGRGIPSEITVKRIPSTGTMYVEAMLRVTEGPLTSERIRYRGYLKNRKQAENVKAELRAAGWRGKELGDWVGFGSKEIQFRCFIDDGTDAMGMPTDKQYARAAFLQEPRGVSDKNAVRGDELAILNAQLGFSSAGESLDVDMNSSDDGTNTSEDTPF